MGFSYEIEGLNKLELWASAGRTALQADTYLSTEDLVGLAYEILSELYPQNFLPYWQVIPEQPEEYLSAITVKTNNAIIYWWEFGTNHSRPTVPVQRQSLWFESKIYGWVFKPKTYYIKTSGVPAHNMRLVLRDRLKREAKARWGQSIAAFFTNI